ncbi:MAG TPA: hypothetical protein PLZ45_11115 [Ferruginibacter sp.]|nr:hypothetical protein [Ferruginibacter sp.]
MKRFILLFAFFFAGYAASVAQDYNSPVEYMSVISRQSENISKKFLSYVSASAHGKRAKKVESLRSRLLDEVQEARMNIAGLPSYKGDKAYRDTTVNFMKLYYNVLNEDYSKIINMEEVAEQSYDLMEAYLLAQELVDKKLDEANDRVKQAQKDFAARNNVTLTQQKGELDDMLKQVTELNKYYHEVYLIFFRPYKQEAYLMEAIEKGNITGIEQNKSALLKYAQEGLQKLNGIKAFQGDNALTSSCRAMLDFYVMEVNDKMGSISEFFLTKERFDAIKKEFDKKGNRTKEDVDAYNKSVNEVNSASQAYNNTNQQLNKKRNDALNDWNKAVNDFFNEHTPHYK